MLGNILTTVLVFVLATTICITLNFVLTRTARESLPLWVKQLTYVGCVAGIMVSVYVVVSKLWGM